MTEIDYEALAKAAFVSESGLTPDDPYFAELWNDGDDKDSWVREARAVVAALRDQGFVVVRAEDIEPLLLFVDDGHVLDRLTTATAVEESNG